MKITNKELEDIKKKLDSSTHASLLISILELTEDTIDTRAIYCGGYKACVLLLAMGIVGLGEELDKPLKEIGEDLNQAVLDLQRMSLEEKAND